MSDEKNFTSSIPLDEGYSHIFNKQAAFLSNVNVGNNLHADNSLYATNTVYSSADVTEKMLVFEDRRKSFIVTQLGKPDPEAKSFAIALCDAMAEDASVYGSIVFDSPTSNSLNKIDITLTVINGEAKGCALYNLDNSVVQFKLCKFVDKKLFCGLYVSSEDISVDSIWFYGFVRNEPLEFGNFSQPETVEEIPLLSTYYENDVVFKKNIFKRNKDGVDSPLAEESYVENKINTLKTEISSNISNSISTLERSLLNTIEDTKPKYISVTSSSAKSFTIVADTRVHVIPNVTVELYANDSTRAGTILNVFALAGCTVYCYDRLGNRSINRTLRSQTMVTFAYLDGTWSYYGVHGAVWND